MLAQTDARRDDLQQLYGRSFDLNVSWLPAQPSSARWGVLARR